MKQMKEILTICVSAFLVSAVSAEVRLGDAGALAFGLDLGARYSSNTLLNSAEKDDMIYTALPTVNFRSDEGAMSIDAFAGVALIRYSDFDSYDSENFKSGFTAMLPDEDSGENYSLIFKGGLNQATAARAAILDVIETETFDLSANGSYYVSEYVSLRSGVFYEDRNAKTDGFTDVETTKVPFAVYYDYDETLSVGLGYRYRRSEVSGTANPADSNDHTVFIGVEDLISPLIQYQLQLGYQYRDFSDNTTFDDGGGVYSELILTWKLTAITDVVAVAGNEFSTSAANQSSETFYTKISLNHRFDPRIHTALGAKFEDTTYEQIDGTRDDDEWGVFLNVDYKILDDKWVLSSGVAYTDRRSDVATANYDVIEVSIACKLLF
jgi:hypothetical protein